MRIPVLAANAALSQMHAQLKPALILLAVILGMLIAASVAFTIIFSRTRVSRSRRRTRRTIVRMMYATTCLVFICTLACFIRYNAIGKKMMAAGNNPSASTPATDDESTIKPGDTTPSTTEPEETVPEPTFTPESTEASVIRRYTVPA